MSKFIRFRPMIIRNEFRVLRGAGYRTVLYLIGILYLAFLCIGFSGSALLFQGQLARDPLSNWINIPISRNTRDSAENLACRLADTALRKRYLIGNYYLSKEFGASFLDRSGRCTGLPLPKARTTDPRSNVVGDLLRGVNLSKIRAPHLFLSDPSGFIVTRAFLERLGFPPDSTGWLSYRLYYQKFVPVAILAVCEELPGQADILCTDSFYRTQNWNYPDDSLCSMLWLASRDAVTIKTVKSAIGKAAGLPEGYFIADTAGGYDGSLTILYFRKAWPGTGRIFQNNLSLLREIPEMRNLAFGTWYEATPPPTESSSIGQTAGRHEFNYDYLSLEFEKPDRVKEFTGFISERYGLRMSMETVTRQQNYLFSLNVSLGAIALVLALAALAVTLFLSSTLKLHLDRVKRNLGSLLAFGATGRQITGIYLEVVTRILVVSVLVSLVLAWVSGEMFDHHLLKRLLVLDSNADYFNLINPWLAVFLPIVFAVALFKTLITLSLLVRHSPGDLIYERAGD